MTALGPHPFVAIPVVVIFGNYILDSREGTKRARKVRKEEKAKKEQGNG